MFETTLNSSWDERSRRGLSTITSFGIQAVVVSLLLLLPLLRPTGLPLMRQLSAPVSLGQPLGESSAVRTQGDTGAAPSTDAAENFPRMPSQIPHGISTADDDSPPQIGGFGHGVPGNATLGDPHSLPGLPGGVSRPVMPSPPEPPPVVHTVRISQMSEGNLISKVLPVYPPLAKMARIQGTVVLEAIISKDGAIENLKVMSGHPMLAPAAVEAVHQWHYRPYVLNHEPVEVETQITVNFFLGEN